MSSAITTFNVSTMHNINPRNVFATGPGSIEGVSVAGRLLYHRLEWEEQIALLHKRGMFIDGVLIPGTAGCDGIAIQTMTADNVQNDFTGDDADHFEAQVHALRAKRC